jgi:hypothetical protein
VEINKKKKKKMLKTTAGVGKNSSSDSQGSYMDRLTDTRMREFTALSCERAKHGYTGTSSVCNKDEKCSCSKN